MMNLIIDLLKQQLETNKLGYKLKKTKTTL